MVFTGIIQTVGSATFDFHSSHLTVSVDKLSFWSDCHLGDSISINGCCLTILNEDSFQSNNLTRKFFIMQETLTKTNFNYKTRPSCNSDDTCQSFFVNIEKALQYGSPLGGHVVTGHVNGVAVICDIVHHSDASLDLWVDLKNLTCYSKFVFKQGSIAIDGVSLTIADVNLSRVKVCLIPHTQNNTIFKYSKIGDYVNIEIDNSGHYSSWADCGEVLESETRNLNYHKNLAKKLQLTSDMQDMPSWELLNDLIHSQKFHLLDWSEKDVFFMCRAIHLAIRGRYSTCPNPWVGALVVNEDGIILGEGYHKKSGEPHAEVMAVRNASDNGHDDLKGATLYCTLEPCNHYGKTPPCSSMILQNGFKRIVVSIVDPDEKVSGNGLSALTEKNCDVKYGVLDKLYSSVLRPYLYHRTNGMPWVVLKVGMSLDAKIGRKICQSENDRWMSSSESQIDSHKRFRCTSQAIIVGSKTAIVDNPKLNIRHFPSDVNVDLVIQPYRVILSTGPLNEIPSNLLDQSLGNVLIFTAIDARWDPSLLAEHSIFDTHAESTIKNFDTCHIQLIRVNLGSDDFVDFKEVLKQLSLRNVMQVLVEGGSTLSYSLLTQSLVNELIIYQSSQIIGPDGISWLEPNFTSSSRRSMPKLSLKSLRAIGPDTFKQFLINTNIL